jgi:large subunit ribosomal protein L29
MNAAELRKGDVDTLSLNEKDLRKQLATLFMQKATNALKNTKKIMEVKRDIARVLTVLRDKTKFKENK